ISDRVEEAQAISQEADQVQEKLENAEDNVYENFREMMENDPETYASLRQEYGYNDTADDIREEVEERRQ
ncbi:MAG: hypothetical protein SVU32_01975, partial [Candidatus Nanohaloarchaea archaeon]|nr:hypothetical protein [Candidatus Nanohaloarchaea archaeon]